MPTARNLHLHRRVPKRTLCLPVRLVLREENQMNISIKKMTFLAVAIGVAIPLSIRAVDIGIHNYRLVMAAQAVTQSGFNGVTAVQAEIMNCKLPPTGKQRIANTRKRAIAADGSLSDVIRYTGSDETRGTIRRADGAFIQTFEHIKSKTSVQTQTIGPLLKTGLRNPATDCLVSFSGEAITGEHKIGEEMLLGHRTIKTLLESHDRRMTTWMAPDLGCFGVQLLLEFYDPQQPGKVMSNSLIVTESLLAGPPDSGLFEPPPGLVERKPSEITLENTSGVFGLLVSPKPRRDS
jgi:hypothetical protein